MDATQEYKKMRKQFLLKGQYPDFCGALLTLVIGWAGLSNLDLPNIIIYCYLAFWLIGFIIYLIGWFNLNALIFSECYWFILLALLGLSSFLIGLLSQNPDLIDQGFALGMTPKWGWFMAILGVSISFYTLYQRFKTIDYNYYFKETLAAKNYDINHKLYFVNQTSKEPELDWKFSGLLACLALGISLLFPLGTGSAYITLMARYHPFTLNRFLFYLSLPVFLAFGFASIVVYVRYHSYKRIQQELGVKLKPAVKD